MLCAALLAYNFAAKRAIIVRRRGFASRFRLQIVPVNGGSNEVSVPNFSGSARLRCGRVADLVVGMEQQTILLIDELSAHSELAVAPPTPPAAAPVPPPPTRTTTARGVR